MFKEYSEKKQFISDITNLGNYNFFKLYYLNYLIYATNNQPINMWIYKNENRWCIGYYIIGNYCLNGYNLQKEDIESIRNYIKFEQLTDNTHFLGDTDIIEELSKSMGNFEKFKERFFYAVNKLKPIKTPSETKISLLEKEEIEKVIPLYSQYYKEEYEGKNNKADDEVRQNIEYCVKEESIYKLEYKNELIGFCTKMEFLSGMPNMIGTIFISQKYRNKKYGQYLLYYVTQDLLKGKAVPEIYLMTTKENIGSNKMVENIGFIKIHEHSDRIFKK